MDWLEQIKSVVGPRGWVEAPEERDRYLVDMRGVYEGNAALIVRPANTSEIAAVVRCCARHSIPIVPQGGNTSLCGGATPDTSGRAVVICLERMKAIREVDVANASMTVEAGVVLADAQHAAREEGLFLPLTLGAEGSCQIGGLVSTNAGGHHVRKYGSTRNLVLGLEVVLPNGSVLGALRSLRKDNMGYDLKHLFIGAEGTLGIVTAATLKLFPQPRNRVVALASVESLQCAVSASNALLERCSAELAVCELMSSACVDMAVHTIPGVRAPFASPCPWLLLLEFEGDDGLEERIESVLAAQLDDGTLEDVLVANSLSQAAEFWHLREAIVEAERLQQGSVKHDIALPISAIPRFVDEISPTLRHMLSGVRIHVFGHLGDGNLHFNLIRPVETDRSTFFEQAKPLSKLIHQWVRDANGTISAEHGIGQSKVMDLQAFRDPVELSVMAAVKRALDPAGVMNPGKVLRAEGGV